MKIEKIKQEVAQQESANIVEKVRRFVEEECKKPTSKYGYEIYPFHITSVYKYSCELAKKLNADKEIVEIAALLHDIGSVMCGRIDHHLTGSIIAEKKLQELGYSQERIDKIKYCILTHRGSLSLARETKEAQILAEADAMSHFDSIGGMFKAALLHEDHTQESAEKSVKRKLINSWHKLSKEAQKILKPKYEAIKILLKD